jgi:dihydrofolate reductase
MSKIILGTTISLDGFMNDSNGSTTALYPNLKALADTWPLQDAIENTGAVVMGHNTYRMTKNPDLYAEVYEFQVPLFIVTNHPPQQLPKQNDKLTFTFVTTGIEAAISMAKASAGEKRVTVVGGANIFDQCIQVSLADELHMDIAPVLLGAGLPFNIGKHNLNLEKTLHMELPEGRTHMRFRLIK